MFLLATRIDAQPSAPLKADEEDTALLLLRVAGGSPLPNHAETSKHRMDAGFRSTDTGQTWDSDKKTDQFTLHLLRYAGVRCDVLGTFRMKEIENSSWDLSFGADISNFYSGQGMKVYKPMGDALRRIVNYTKPTGNPHTLAGNTVGIGRVRYCASEILVDDSKENVAVGLEPTDLLARRAALFGMSRSGKSNTIKIIASSIFNLRKKGDEGRIGQLIFDVNGEYCNDNPQDEGCLRNIWRTDSGFVDSDVSTYGLFKHPNDPNRKLLKLNFFGNEPSSPKWADWEDVVNAMATLNEGKTIIDEALLGETGGYIKPFRNTSFSVPGSSGEWKGDIYTRYRRSVQIYRSILAGAGFTPPQNMAYIEGLFSKEFRGCMGKKFPDSAEVLGEKYLPWNRLYKAGPDLGRFIKTREFEEFDSARMNAKKEENKRTGAHKPVTPWADETLERVLSLFENTRGLRVIGDVQHQHDPSVDSDYSEDIINDVRGGKLVIVDQSTGAPDQIQRSADRIMLALFNKQKSNFVHPEIDNDGKVVPPPDVVVYAEEAHNLLPAKTNADELKSVWARTAKEGSKFHIGMVYSTQEPSSILPNILKNTDNWFVAHLNNQDEIKELKKYYDFAAFAQQILKVPETGFLRMRCLSNPYIVPVQVWKFTAPAEGE